MTKLIRSMAFIVATIFLILGLSIDRVSAAIASKERIIYSISGYPIGKIPSMGNYQAIARLPDRRLKIRYGNLIGYIRP